MPRTLEQAGGLLFGLWMALVVLQPMGTSAEATTDAPIANLESVLHILPTVEEGIDRVFLHTIERDLTDKE